MSAPEPGGAWQPYPGAAVPAPGTAPEPPVAGRAAVPVRAVAGMPAPAGSAAPAGMPATGLPAAVPAGADRAAPVLTSAPLTRVAVPEQPGGGPPGEPPGGPSGVGGEPGGPTGRAGRLHIGGHTITRDGLRRVAAGSPVGAGLLLGRDQRQMAVPVRIFRPEPVRVALIGGVWAAQLLVFRAFALGARVVVVSTEPHAWAGLGERATGQYNRFAVTADDQGGVPPGTAQVPTLVVYDLGMTGPAASPALGAWSTQLTVLRQLDRPGTVALQEADMTLLQRLGGDEATVAAAALRLSPHTGQFLQFMADGMVALLGPGEDRFVFLAQTVVEQQYVGPPRR